MYDWIGIIVCIAIGLLFWMMADPRFSGEVKPKKQPPPPPPTPYTLALAAASKTLEEYHARRYQEMMNQINRELERRRIAAHAEQAQLVDLILEERDKE